MAPHLGGDIEEELQLNAVGAVGPNCSCAGITQSKGDAGKLLDGRASGFRTRVLAVVMTNAELTHPFMSPLRGLGLSLVKTSCTRRMNDLEKGLMQRVSVRFWP